MLFSRTKRARRGLRSEIDELQAAARESSDPELLRRLRTARHELGEQLIADAGPRREYSEPDFDALPESDGVPEVDAADLTGPVLRAAILSKGALLVRGLVDPGDAAAITHEADAALAARQSGNGDSASAAHYDEYEPGGRYQIVERGFVEDVGGFWIADAPAAMAAVFDVFDRAQLSQRLGEYLGESPLVSMQKWTLRKVDRAKVGWHQDGAFLGDVHTVNVWLALTRCGDDSPGLDLVPRRLDHVLETGTEGADYEFTVSPILATETAGETPVARPIFEAGDALLFDQLLLHGTAQDSKPGRVRYACETWFFGPSGFPPEYLPLAY